LHASNRMFFDRENLSIELIAEPIFLLNKNLCFENVNSAFLKLMSLSSEHVIGQSFESVFQSAYSSELIPAFKSCFQTSTKIQVEDFNLNAEAWLQYHINKIGDTLSVLVLDITKTKLSENADSKHWRSIIESSPLGIIQINLDGRWSFINNRASEILGEKISDLEGKSFNDYFYKDDVLVANARMVDLVQGSKQTFTTEQQIILKCGREIWIRLNLSLVRSSNGAALFFVAAFDNIDERKEAEASLQFALQAAQLGDWDFDAVTNTTRRSRKFDEIYGHSVPIENWGYDDFAKQVHPEDREQFGKSFIRALCDAEEFRIDTRILWPNQSVRWISLRGRVYTNRQGRAVRMAGLVMDTTAETLASQEIQNARLAAEDANREKSYFLANMSHEIRTPIGAILGFTDALRESKRHRYLGILRRNGENLARLINDILDLSKVEAGFLEIENTKVNLSDMIEEVVSLFSITAGGKGLQLIKEASPELPTEIVTDGIRLRQILTNIIGNALKFTQEGSVKFQILKQESATGRPSRLEFRVIDTGPGIDPESVRKLFNPFMQADSSTTRKFGGTGLGLALSRRLARSMGGDLILEQSSLGAGSSFLIIIPLVLSQPQQLSSSDEDHYNEVIEANKTALEKARRYNRGLKGIKVLLAEDSVDNQELIMRMLNKQGITAELADDGAQAVEKALRDSYDIVLMDMQMPKLDGYSATRKLRRAGFEGPILALTANAMRSDREKCMAAGCDEYLTKPIDPSKLIELIGSMVDSN
jgi:PAS domain S-box-containing protein